jgi:hypothetical protein
MMLSSSGNENHDKSTNHDSKERPKAIEAAEEKKNSVNPNNLI